MNEQQEQEAPYLTTAQACKLLGKPVLAFMGLRDDLGIRGVRFRGGGTGLWYKREDVERIQTLLGEPWRRDELKREGESEVAATR